MPLSTVPLLSTHLYSYQWPIQYVVFIVRYELQVYATCSCGIQFKICRMIIKFVQSSVVLRFLSYVILSCNCYTHVGSVEVSSGDYTMGFKVIPSFDRVTSATSETALTTTERYLFGRYELVEFTFGRYTQSVCERSRRTKCLTEEKKKNPISFRLILCWLYSKSLPNKNRSSLGP